MKAVGAFDLKAENRSHPLDGLRGLAAFAVVIYHAVLMEPHYVSAVLMVPIQELSSLGDIATKLVLSVFNGQTAVALFFVLSGFVLRLSLAGGQTPNVAIRFIIRRACRLMPALWFALAFGALVGLYLGVTTGNPSPAADIGVILKNASLLEMMANGASWTIQVEAAVTPLVLIASYLLDKRLAVVVLGYAVLASAFPILVGVLPVLATCLLPFALGMVFADPRISDFVGGGELTMWACVFALVLLKLLLPADAYSAVLVQHLMAAFLVAGVYRAPSSSPMARVLAHSATKRLGAISYSFYLLNVPLLWIFAGFPLIADWHPLARGLFIGLTVSAVTVPLAMFAEKYVERPGIQLGRWLTSRPTLKGRRTVAAAAP